MTRSATPKHKVQMTIRLEPDVEKAAVAFSRRTGIPVSVVVADAAKQVLIPRADDPRLSLEQATERVLRRLGKIDSTLRADLNELRELMALAVRTYLNHTPAVPESERFAASMSGRIRFDRLVELLDQNLRDGLSILTTLPPETQRLKETDIDVTDVSQSPPPLIDSGQAASGQQAAADADT